jgi:uncharacterized protein YecE (DUF72 family)
MQRDRPELVYYRLHGSPRRYYSAYSNESIENLCGKLAADADSAPTWCIFDNTADGAAVDNALAVWQRLRRRRP